MTARIGSKTWRGALIAADRLNQSRGGGSSTGMRKRRGRPRRGDGSSHARRLRRSGGSRVQLGHRARIHREVRALQLQRGSSISHPVNRISAGQ